MKKVIPLRFVCSGCHRVDMMLDTSVGHVWGCSCCGLGSGIMIPAPGPTFQVGDGVHWAFNGDSYPGTVRKVSKSGLKVWVSSDEHRITDAERERVRAHGFHEGAIDSAFIPVDMMPEYWKCFKFSTARKRIRFTNDGTFSLFHGREYSRNPSF